MNKKGGETILLENVLFIILNLIFFSFLLIFVARASSGASILEEKYAKQIALFIDAAKPGTTINIPLDENALELADKNNLINENNEQNIIKINNDLNEITFKLSQRGGYKHNYYSDVEVIVRFENNQIILIIGEKNVQ